MSRTLYKDARPASMITSPSRNGSADVMLISVAEYESLQETLDILSDEETLADLRQSREEFAAGDTYTAEQVRAEVEQRRHRGER